MHNFDCQGVTSGALLSALSVATYRMGEGHMTAQTVHVSQCSIQSEQEAQIRAALDALAGANGCSRIAVTIL